MNCVSCDLQSKISNPASFVRLTWGIVIGRKDIVPSACMGPDMRLGMENQNAGNATTHKNQKFGKGVGGPQGGSSHSGRKEL